MQTKYMWYTNDGFLWWRKARMYKTGIHCSQFGRVPVSTSGCGHTAASGRKRLATPGWTIATLSLASSLSQAVLGIAASDSTSSTAYISNLLTTLVINGFLHHLLRKSFLLLRRVNQTLMLLKLCWLLYRVIAHLLHQKLVLSFAANPLGKV